MSTDLYDQLYDKLNEQFYEHFPKNMISEKETHIVASPYPSESEYYCYFNRININCKPILTFPSQMRTWQDIIEEKTNQYAGTR